jgi:hypothetical protein
VHAGKLNVGQPRTGESKKPLTAFVGEEETSVQAVNIRG